MSDTPCALAEETHPSGGEDSDELRARIWALLERVSDPEIPVISLLDLGVVRDVRWSGAAWQVVITPTYSGCPAMAQMADDIVAVLAAEQVTVEVITQLAPAWSTDWISPQGRQKLRDYGIAPPAALAASTSAAGGPAARVLRFMPRAGTAPAVACPRCGSQETVETSHFGSTACKALYRCLSCREPFDYFKPY
ncbi:MAG: 1,2-phenylacetyl-CoA epoxidase subunit PaaD [Betaproteobacteria bacterium]